MMGKLNNYMQKKKKSNYLKFEKKSNWTTLSHPI